MKQLIAGIVALMMITGAWMLADSMNGDDDPKDNSPRSTVAEDRPVRMLCATEFSATCKAVADELGSGVKLTVADPATTLDGLEAGEAAPFDLWLTADLWTELASFSGADRGLTISEPLARAELQIVARREQLAVVRAACSDTLDGRCLAGLAGRKFAEIAPGTSADTTPVRFGVDRSTRTAGRLALGAFLSGWDVPEDPGVGDFDALDEFSAGLARAGANAKRPNNTKAGPAQAILLSPEFTLAFDLATAGLVARAANGDRFEVASFTPPIDTLAVAVTPDTDRGADARETVTVSTLRDAIIDSGWTAADDSDRPQRPADADVLDALTPRWSPR